jgi:hypothetical protein
MGLGDACSSEEAQCGDGDDVLPGGIGEVIDALAAVGAKPRSPAEEVSDVGQDGELRFAEAEVVDGSREGGLGAEPMVGAWAAHDIVPGGDGAFQVRGIGMAKAVEERANFGKALVWV